MGCHTERTGLAGVTSWDRRGWEQDCGDLGAQNRESGRKTPLQQGDEQHPGTNIFGGASVPQGGELTWEQRTKTWNKKLRCTRLDFFSYDLQGNTRHILCGSHSSPEDLPCYKIRKWGEKKKNVEKQYSVTQQTQQARNVQPVAAISCSYLHNGFPDVLKWLLHKFTDTMDLPSGYDKVLGLIRLQHQPHGLWKDKVRFSAHVSGLFGTWYYITAFLI